MRWWAEGEENFPADREEVEDGLACGYVGDLSVLALGWVEHDSIEDLLSPGDVLFTVDPVEELLKGFSLLFGLGIGDDFNKDTVLLRDLDNVWLGVENLDAEDFVSLDVLLTLLLLDLDDFNHDLLLAFVVLKDNFALSVFVVYTLKCATVFRHMFKFYCFKLTRNFTVRSICPIHDNLAFIFSCHVFNVRSLLLE